MRFVLRWLCFGISFVFSSNVISTTSSLSLLNVIIWTNKKKTNRIKRTIILSVDGFSFVLCCCSLVLLCFFFFHQVILFSSFVFLFRLNLQCNFFCLSYEYCWANNFFFLSFNSICYSLRICVFFLSAQLKTNIYRPDLSKSMCWSIFDLCFVVCFYWIGFFYTFFFVLFQFKWFSCFVVVFFFKSFLDYAI